MKKGLLLLLFAYGVGSIAFLLAQEEKFTKKQKVKIAKEQIKSITEAIQKQRKNLAALQKQKTDIAKKLKTAKPDSEMKATLSGQWERIKAEIMGVEAQLTVLEPGLKEQQKKVAAGQEGTVTK